MRKQKRNYLKKYQKGGGVVATYEPHIKTGETAYANSVMNEFAIHILLAPETGFYGPIFRNGEPALYLAGYSNFIGPNKLLPLEKIYLNPVPYEPPIFYYMSQLVHDSCIITMPRFKRQIADAHGQVWARLTQQFTGYNRKPHIITREKADRETVYVVNTDDPYGDKFLVFPGNSRTIHTFTPTKDSNVYNVPGIGDVIMNDPGNGEPWYDEKVTVIFDYNFKPPKINESTMKDEDIDEDTGIHKDAFAAVGAKLHNMEDE